MKLALIAAVASNGAIGKDNDLIFGDPVDQKHFRATTMGYPVIMGRKTWDSLPVRFRPLPGRRNIVVTRTRGFQAPGADVVHSLQAALALAATADWAFVMGGGELYAQALPQAAKLVLTEVEADLEGDVFFPVWDRAAFRETRRSKHKTVDGTPFAIVSYEAIADR